ncbi:PTS sugar transporter subunit IIB [Streptococcus porcinus]|uniref:Phosphotransferase system protein n=2 Tax=Streptococcus porcinus TaxID=1340 RepID=A0A4V0GY90_STRPO|nr:PTS sugar transporter subunit IIB [Streptococcus porcinus]EGJ26963.1 putative galactitol-specific phosphotransferase enzyme IIB component [Streptococcus porcinus str. Jelinkova 176]SQG42560.1 phosphotransferase system protein [Streptococcus porcinus]VTT41601.1 phosphotransferase system protein [Streptococcus porcinus]VTT42610.1 phosphotransferase system protein [Streptococcus porcinus]
MKKINILVACGSGIATSTLAADEVKSVCQEYGIDNYQIIKSSMQELQSAAKEADVILTTSVYRGTLSKPYLSVSSFITGINEEKTRAKLGELLQEVTQSNNG